MSCHHHDLGSTSDRSCREKYFLQPITNIRWLVWTKHVPESKNTFQSPKRVPESKNSSQNPKHFPDSKNTSRIQNTSKIQKHFSESKTLPRIQNTSIRESKTLRSENPKALVITQNTSPKPKTLLDSGKCFGFGDMFLDSGKCFGFWNVFLDSGTCFGFCEVFFLFWDELWILGSVLSLSDTVQTLPRPRQ